MSEPQAQGAFDHTGSSLDSLLQDVGILEEVEAAAIKRVVAWQLAETMKAQHITKRRMAERMGTSRSQLDRLLDPANPNVSLTTIARAAKVVGKRLKIEMIDVS